MLDEADQCSTFNTLITLCYYKFATTNMTATVTNLDAQHSTDYQLTDTTNILLLLQTCHHKHTATATNMLTGKQTSMLNIRHTAHCCHKHTATNMLFQEDKLRILDEADQESQAAQDKASQAAQVTFKIT